MGEIPRFNELDKSLPKNHVARRRYTAVAPAVKRKEGAEEGGNREPSTTSGPDLGESGAIQAAAQWDRKRAPLRRKKGRTTLFRPGQGHFETDDDHCTKRCLANTLWTKDSRRCPIKGRTTETFLGRKPRAEQAGYGR